MILSYDDYRLLKEGYTSDGVSYDGEVLSELLSIINSEGYISESDLNEFFDYIYEEYGLELGALTPYEWLSQHFDLIDQNINETNGTIYTLTNRGKLYLNEDTPTYRRSGGIIGGIKNVLHGKEEEVGGSKWSGFGRGVKDVLQTGLKAGGDAYKSHVKAKNKMDARDKRHQKWSDWRNQRHEIKMAKIGAKRDIGIAKAGGAR